MEPVLNYDEVGEGWRVAYSVHEAWELNGFNLILETVEGHEAFFHNDGSVTPPIVINRRTTVRALHRVIVEELQITGHSHLPVVLQGLPIMEVFVKEAGLFKVIAPILQDMIRKHVVVLTDIIPHP